MGRALVSSGWWWGVQPAMRRSVAIAVLALLAAARAGAAPPFPSVAEQIAGARMDLAPVRVSLGGAPASLRIEIADTELYGIAGLRSSGLRVATLHRSLIVAASAVNVASPVGAHTRAMVEAGCKLGTSWQGAVRVGVERLTLDVNEPVAWRVAGVASRADVGRVSAVADVELVEGAGTYETSMVLATRVHAGIAQLIGSVRIDGDRFAGAGVAMVARVHSSLALTAGYDDGAESLRGGALINWGRIEIATGVFQHPVLGMSEGVSIACVR